MPDLTPSHPAVEAARVALFLRRHPEAEGVFVGADTPYGRDALAALTVARERYTADDLRDTPGGRDLKAEGWDEGALRQARGSAETRRVLASALPNPYREGAAHE